MGVTDSQRLSRLLGDPDLSWLIDRVRRRMSRGEPLDGTVTLTEASPAQRAAVHRLLGRRPRPGAALTVSLAGVDEVVRHCGACPDGLAAAVVTLTGAVTDRVAEAASLDRRWAAAFTRLDTLEPPLAPWRDRMRASGLVRRLAGTPENAAALLADLTAVLAELPVRGEPLGRFAARVLGEAHALDADRPLATLTLGAARAMTGLPDGAGAGWRREVWASVGLLSDEVSSTALVLGLPGDTVTATGRALAAWHEVGQPVVLTLRQLVRDPPRLVRPSRPTVFICENPTVVSEAADRLGSGCAPLICTNGQPGAAVLHLLRQLACLGAALRYHGDFDWGGLRIGNVVFDRVPAAVPWRYRTADYVTAHTDNTANAVPGRTLTGTAAEANWDPHLSPAMRETGAAVEEEHVIDTLLTDLAN
jgi:uncharacterized protein (TIGR02679 family)